MLNICMSVLNVLLNLLLIPRYGHLGAACATFGAICIYGALQYGYMKYYLPDHIAHISLPPVVVLAAGLTGFSIWLLLNLSILLAMASALLVYVTALIFGGFFSKAELELLGVDRIFNRVGLSGALRR
jgi:O-antigen/teichoic acid export membrane protein